MLVRVSEINPETVAKLFAVYDESMADMRENFGDEQEMHDAYAEFLQDFVSEQTQLVLAEEVEDRWVSALRAIATSPDKWSLEAVETAPELRGKGYGKLLLKDSIAYLAHLGAKTVECIIADNNSISMKLHSACGFEPTKDAPVNCWNELEEGCILFRRNIV